MSGAEEGRGAVVILRHALAGTKDEDGIDDSLRPLDARGLRTATRLPDALEEAPVTAIVSSPSLRCVQTVEPLARRRSLTIVELGALGPDATAAEAVEAIRALPDGAVACTHGEVIGRLSPAMADCEKGGAWVVSRSGGVLEPTRYLPPPC